MVEVLGNAIAHTAGGHRPLPRADAAAGVRRAHRPWCTDCKRAHDAEQLDDNGRCPTCAPMAERRAAAAERRRLADQADAAAPKPAPKPAKTAAPARAPKANRPTRQAPAAATPSPRPIPHPAVMRAVPKPAPTPARSTRDDLKASDPAVAGTGMDTTSDTSVDTKTLNPGDRAPSDQGRDHATSQVSPGDQAPDTAYSGVDTTTPLADPDEWTPAAELDAQVQHVTRLLRATNRHPELLVRTLRTNAIAALEALHLVHEIHGNRPVPAPVSASTAAAAPSAPRAEQTRRQPATTRGHRGADVDETAVITAYRDGTSAPDLARTHDCTPKRIRAILERHHVPLRDDRATNSGSQPQTLPTADVETICRLYVEQHMAILDIAHRVRHHARVVRRTLEDAGVTIRPPASVSKATALTTEQEAQVVATYLEGNASMADVARGYKIRVSRVRDLLLAAGHTPRSKGGIHDYAQRLTDLGTTGHQVKVWAHDQGLADAPRAGRVPGHLLDAYAEAHPTADHGSTTPSTTNQAGDAA